MDLVDGRTNELDSLVSGYTFAYVLEDEKDVMHVLAAVDSDGRRLVTRLCAEPSYEARVHALTNGNLDWLLRYVVAETVDLAGPEPNWDRVKFGDAGVRLVERHLSELSSIDGLPVGPVARCPNGHRFTVSTGYRAGDRCLGIDQPTRADLKKHTVACTYIF